MIALPGRDDRDHATTSSTSTAEPLDEPYLTQAAKDATGDYPLHTVPDDALFVMGDNRGNSADSRYGLGFVPLDKVIGKAFVLIWPPSHIGGI